LSKFTDRLRKANAPRRFRAQLRTEIGERVRSHRRQKVIAGQRKLPPFQSCGIRTKHALLDPHRAHSTGCDGDVARIARENALAHHERRSSRVHDTARPAHRIVVDVRKRHERLTARGRVNPRFAGARYNRQKVTHKTRPCGARLEGGPFACGARGEIRGGAVRPRGGVRMNRSLAFGILHSGGAFNDRKEDARLMRSVGAEVHEMAERRSAAEAAGADQ
jgi:hypothetical protein